MRLCQYKNILGRWPVTKSLLTLSSQHWSLWWGSGLAPALISLLCVFENEDPMQLTLLGVLQKTTLLNSFPLQKYRVVWTTLELNLDSHPSEQFPTGITWTACLGKLHSDWWDRSTWAQGSHHFLFCWKAAIKTSSRLPLQSFIPNAFSKNDSEWRFVEWRWWKKS